MNSECYRKILVSTRCATLAIITGAGREKRKEKGNLRNKNEGNILSKHITQSVDFRSPPFYAPNGVGRPSHMAEHIISWVNLLLDILKLEFLFTQVERSANCTMVLEGATQAVKLYKILRANFIPK